MRPRFRVDAPLGLFLNTIITDRGSGVQAVRDVLVRQLHEVARLRGMIRPDARVAIRLEFGAHRCTLWPGLVSGGTVENAALQILHMMTVLVRDDILLREGSACRTELRLQVIVETEINVDRLVIRQSNGPTAVVAAPQPVCVWPVKRVVGTG